MSWKIFSDDITFKREQGGENAKECMDPFILRDNRNKRTCANKHIILPEQKKKKKKKHR